MDAFSQAAVDLTDPAAFVDGPPHEFLTRLRHDEPVWWHPGTERFQGFWVLTRYDDVDDVIRRPSTFINAKGITVDPKELVALSGGDDGPDGETGQTALSYTDPPHHRKLRQVIARHFVARRLDPFLDLVRTHARTIVDEFASSGGDFIAAVAEPYPLRILAAVLDLPPDASAALTRFAMAASDWSDSFMDAAIEFLGAVYPLAEQRRENPGDDVISAMVTADGEGGALAVERLGGVLIQLAIAGNETTRAAAGHAARLFAERPDYWRTLVEDTDRMPAAIEEVLRYRPPVHYLRRTVAEETTIGSGAHARQVAPDDVVYLSIASANRDEAVFDDADEFDPTKVRDRPHIGFGVGEHFCIGATLARLELRCLLEELARAMPTLQMTGAAASAPSALFDVLAHLPLKRVVG